MHNLISNSGHSKWGIHSTTVFACVRWADSRKLFPCIHKSSWSFQVRNSFSFLVILLAADSFTSHSPLSGHSGGCYSTLLRFPWSRNLCHSLPDNLDTGPTDHRLVSGFKILICSHISWEMLATQQSDIRPQSIKIKEHSGLSFCPNFLPCTLIFLTEAGAGWEWHDGT